MHHDVGAEIDGLAENRRGEGIVDNQRNAVGVSHPGKFLNIQHRQGRIGQRLAEYRLGVRLKGFGDGFLIRIGIHENTFDPQAFSAGRQTGSPSPRKSWRC